MGWAIRLRQLPLRTKLVITALGVAVAMLGMVTQVSFRYWKREALAAAEQQALLAGRSARTLVETSLLQGRQEQAHRSLRRLTEEAPVNEARVWGGDGTILLSSTPAEEGTRLPNVWIPARGAVPPSGMVHPGSDGNTVRAFFPLDGLDAALLEVGFSVAPVRTAMDRGARLGLGLTAASLLAIATVLFTLIEREVVAPVERMRGMLARTEDGDPDAAPAPGSALAMRAAPGRGVRADELRHLEASVAQLVEQEQAARELAAEQGKLLRHQQGLAEVGELAAEMAHEFKRPLASIRSALELLEQEYVLGDRAQTLLGAVDGQLEKLSETMRDLFALARPVALEGEEVDLPAALDEAVGQLAGHPAAAGVRVVRRYAPHLPPIVGDRRRLEQAVANLLLNAAEAMGGEGGVVELAARPRGGDEVEITVTDTGPGIPPEAVEKVLLPFYSTKPAGTGLGLPLVARIVAAHGGSLAVEPGPGGGTRVSLTLPLALATGTTRPREAAWPTPAS